MHFFYKYPSLLSYFQTFPIHVKEKRMPTAALASSTCVSSCPYHIGRNLKEGHYLNCIAALFEDILYFLWIRDRLLSFFLICVTPNMFEV
jgi:hypothetical protein